MDALAAENQVLREKVAVLEADNAALKSDNAALKAENADLRAQLRTNSTNSSKPPSSDPPSVERPQKGPTGRTRRAQPGHKGH